METWSFEVRGDEECWRLFTELQGYNGSNPIDTNQIMKLGLAKAIQIEKKKK